MLSNDCQTNVESVGIDSEDIPLFSRNEPHRLLLDAFAVNDEEQTLLSSIPHNRRKNISWFSVNPIPSPNGDYSW